MNKIKQAAFILCCCMTLSACGEKASNPPQSSLPATSTDAPTSSGSEGEENKNPPINLTADQLVQEAEFSKGEIYRFPSLNEELLGEMAKIYNNKIAEIYETAKESFEAEEGGPYYQEMAESTDFFAFIDRERGWFSVVSNYLDPRGYTGFEPMTLDLRNENRQIPLSTALEAYGWTEDQLREKVEDYFKRMYIWDMTAYENNVHSGEMTAISLDEFLDQRMTALNEDLKRGLPYSIGDHGITVYFISGFPTFYEGYEDSLLLQKTAVEELLNNHIYGSPAAIIHRVTDDDRKLANIVEKIHTDESAPEKLVMAMRNDVLLKIERVKYDEKEGVYVVEEELFKKTLAKGETVSLKTPPNDGFANILISGEFVFNPDHNEFYTFQYPLLKKGLYADPNIELLQGIPEHES